MPKVVLEFEVTSTGETKISTLSGALDGIKLKAGATADAQDKLAASGKKLEESQTQLGKTGAALRDELTAIGQQGLGLMGTVGSLVGRFGPLGVAIGATAYAAHAAIADFTALATQVRDLSYLSGASARDVSVLVTGLEDLGVSSDTVQQAIAFMSNAVANGSTALNRLGISTRDSNGALKNGLALFYESVDALASVKSEVDRANIARELFGRGWTQMIPIIEQGTAKIRELGEENVRAGKAMDEAGIQKARAYQLALKDLGNQWEALKVTVGGGIIAPITLVMQAANLMMNPSGAALGASVDAAERERILAQIDPTGRLRASLPSGAFSADVGAWRFGSPGATVSGAVPGTPDGPTRSELAEALRARQLTLIEAQATLATAGAMPAGLGRIDAQTKAAQDTARAQRQVALAELELQIKDGKIKREQEGAERAAIEATAQAKLAQIGHEAEEQRRAERIRVNGLTVKDQERLLDEESILQSIQLAGSVEQQQANQQKIAELTEYYRGVKAQDDTEEERRRRETLAAGAAFDDTLNQMRVEDYRVSEAQIAEARERARRKRMDDALYEFQSLQRNYDDDVQKAIAAELLKTGLWQNTDRKHLDTVIGTYDKIEARRQQDVENQRKSLLIQMAATGDYFDKTKLALTYHLTDWRTTDQRILDITREFGSAAVKTLDDVYFNVLTGRFETLTDVVKQFGESLLRIGTQELARATLSYLGGGSGGSGILGGIGAGASIANATTGGGGSGGGAGNLLSGIPVVGLIDKLSGGALSSTVSGWLGTSGVSAFPMTDALSTALGASTAEFSDLGLLSATTLSNTGALAGTTAGSMYSGLSASTLAEISGAAGTTGAGATGGLSGALAAAAPAAALAIPAILFAIAAANQRDPALNWSASASAMTAAAGPFAGMSDADLLTAAANATYGTAAAQGIAWTALSRAGGYDPLADYGYNPNSMEWTAAHNNISWSPGTAILAPIFAAMRGGRTPTVAEIVEWQRDQALRDLGWVDTGVGGAMDTRASGGPVTAGRLYRVNEAGTEAFVPAVNGVILSADQTTRAAASGGAPTLVINIDARGSLADARSLAEFVREKIQPELTRLTRLRSGPAYAGA